MPYQLSLGDMLYTISLWIHFLAAMVWIGGMVFLALVVVPVERGISDVKLRYELINKMGVRFKYLGWACIAILIITGLFNALLRIRTWDVLVGTGYGRTLLLKLLLVFLMLILSVLHDFYLGPRVVSQAMSGGKPSKELGLLTSLAKGNLLLGLLVIYLAISMRWGGIL